MHQNVARCRDGDVSKGSLKYDAAECSPGLLSMEWYPSSIALVCRRMFTFTHSKMAAHSQGPRKLGKSPPSELAHGNLKPTKGTSLGGARKNWGKTILQLYVVRELQLTETKKKKTPTKSGKGRQRILHDGAQARLALDTVQFPFLVGGVSPILSSVQE